MQALREQFNNIQEQLQNKLEFEVMKRDLHQKCKEWRTERQALINIIFKLKNILSVKIFKK